MNPLRHSILFLGLIVVGFTACKEVAAPEPMTIDQTKALLLETELGAIEYPAESLDSRAANIRQLVAPYGLTVSISDPLKGDSESVAGDEAIDPFASPSERSSASDPAARVVDDLDDPFELTK
ncbi:MAG: hypothetical protein EOP84_18445 [Verrucomicrobiaceae bacterium]|nr:MAG: hypothetical protein EOP84_18445 [Verrucomicrobiaceae bacterium]